ncbi:hypothetical protein [Xenorhabdus innexi]|uniref:Uncharacterized protein n=1 Tax=Xenorhabdus innexi TaxID=290109 RepID=A0A1N6N216_9GAMM|nr:hypothetical protein [Xenorhabdus innexi]PHM37146.1 hypothetical protein Xinn_01113 [Xenorhabdus innexi]SIP75074.1 conserved hypothetical protein [Xenorhabdus innexi]
MKALAPAVAVRQYCAGINEVEFPEGINRLDGRLEEILDASQWGMNEVAQYLNDRDLIDSLMEELNKLQRRAA